MKAKTTFALAIIALFAFVHCGVVWSQSLSIDEVKRRITPAHEILREYEKLKFDVTPAGVKAAEERVAEEARLAAERAEQQRRETEARRIAEEERKAAEAKAAEAERKRKEEEARPPALKRQIDNFHKYCSPGMKYEGSFSVSGARNDSPPVNVHVVFEEYLSNERDNIRGTIMFSFRNARIERPFVVAANTKEVAVNAVTGEINNSDIPVSSEALFYHTYGFQPLQDAQRLFWKIRDQRSVAIRFTPDNEMNFIVLGTIAWREFDLNLSPVR